MRLFLFFLIYLVQILPAAAELKVVDGDSLELDGARIRLEGIDAPEYHQQCKDNAGKSYACGQVSLDYLKSLVKGQEITCQCADEPDRYGRKLCECFADGLSLNQEMVRAGQAVSYRSEKMNVLEKNAKKEKAGIWQGKFMHPALYRTLYRAKNKYKKTYRK